MTTKLFLEYANFGLVAICATVLVLMGVHRRLWTRFPLVVAFLAVELTNEAISIPLLFFRKYTGLSVAVAYPIYFYSHWILSAVDSVLIIALIYSVFHEAMRPLAGLHRMGKLIFRWVAGVSVALSLCIAIGPHMLSHSSDAQTAAISVATSQVQQGVSVLTLCLLLFVCFSTKPLGLTYRSHLFGISLGLGVYSTVQLLQAAWLATSQAQSVYSPIYLVSCLGTCAAYAVWGLYFALPEPERRMILLPTTSPFFFWNRISEVLGDAPGHVAIAGFKPEMLAPGELKMIEVMGRAARQREENQLLAAEAHSSPLQSMAR